MADDYDYDCRWQQQCYIDLNQWDSMMDRIHLSDEHWLELVVRSCEETMAVIRLKVNYEWTKTTKKRTMMTTMTN